MDGQLNIDRAIVPDPVSFYFYGAGRWGSGIEVPAKDADFYALKDVPHGLVSEITPEAKDAYYQLVLYPAKASVGVSEIYLAASRNNLYAKQGRVSTIDYAKRALDLFELEKN